MIAQGMMVHVWLAYKKGEDRVYTRTTEPPDDLVKKWQGEGFKVYYTPIFLPTEDATPVDAIQFACAQEVPLKDA
jgi:hypothetical protein